MNFGGQDFVQWIGYAAGICLAVANFPQVLKVWKTKSADDLSLRMLLLLITGLSLWCLFGVLKADLPLIVGNGMSLSLVTALLVMKLRFG